MIYRNGVNMRAKNVILFVIGFFLALIAYGIAWFVSVGLAYVFGLIALAFGIYMVVKRVSTGELVLGAVLIAFALLSLAATVVTHVAVLGLQQVVESKSVTASIGERVKAGSWAITVLSVKTPSYINIGGIYYTPSEGKKFVVVSLKIENIGKNTESLSSLWDFTLFTNTNKSYSEAYFPGKILFSATNEVIAKAINVTKLDTTLKLLPGDSIQGDIVFEIPANETPTKLYYKVGIVGGYEVTVKLT